MNPEFYSLKKMMWIIVTLLCLSSGRLQAQIYASTQTNGVTGLCLLCGVNNPNNPVNNASLTDYSTFNITVGLLGTTVYQTLIFPGPGTTGCDSLIIGIGSDNTILSVNLFAGLIVQTFNGAIANNDAHMVDSSNLRLLGNSKGEVILKPAYTFDRVKITLSSSLVGLLNAFHLYYAYYKPSVPTPVTLDTTAVCAGSSTTLTAVGVTGSSIQWYNAAVGGTLLATGNNYVVNPVSTTTYYAAANLNGCISPRKAITVVVNPKPANPVYSVPQGFVCGSQSINVTNHSAGINYKVKLQAINLGTIILDTVYTVINSNIINTPVILSAGPGEAYLYVQAIDQATGCQSDTVEQFYGFSGSGRYPSVDADSVTICLGQSALLHAFNPNSAVTQMLWYTAATGGNLLFTGNYYAVSPLATTTYYVANKFQCEYPIRRPVTVVVTKLPAPVYSVPQAPTCGSIQIKIRQHQSGINYNVHIKYTDPAATVLADTSYQVINKDTVTTPAIMAPYTAQADIYIQAINPVSGCKSDSIPMTFIVGASTGGPAVDTNNLAICAGDSATMHAFDPLFSFSTVSWYDAPVGGNLLHTGNYFKVSPAATTNYYAATAIDCEYPVRKQVTITVNDCFARTTLLLKKTGSPEQLLLYPNPTSGEIRLAAEEDLSGSMVIIKDINGIAVQREILKKKGFSFSKQIRTGLYFIQIITVKKQVYTGKILLQR